MRLHQRQKVRILTEQQRQIQLRAEACPIGRDRSVAPFFDQRRKELFLKLRDLPIEFQRLRGERIFRSQVFGSLDSLVVFGKSLSANRHLRGAEERPPTISSYQPG